MNKKIKILFLITTLIIFSACSRDKKLYEQLESRVSLVNNTKYLEYDTYLKDTNELKKDLQKFTDKYQKSNYYLEIQKELEKTNTLISKITEEKKVFDTLKKDIKATYTLGEAEKELLTFRFFLEKYPDSIKTNDCNEKISTLDLIIFNLKTSKVIINIKELNSLILLCQDYEKKYANKKTFAEEIRTQKNKVELQRPLVFQNEMKEAFKLQDNDAKVKLKKLIDEKFTHSKNFFTTSVTTDFIDTKIVGQGSEKTIIHQYKVTTKFFIGKKEYIYSASYHMIADDLAGVQENKFVENSLN